MSFSHKLTYTQGWELTKELTLYALLPLQASSPNKLTNPRYCSLAQACCKVFEMQHKQLSSSQEYQPRFCTILASDLILDQNS